MTEVPLWLIYKLVDKGNGKFSKPPVSPFTGEICSKTDEGMYTDFNRALIGVEQHDADGLGFVFLHGFVAIDLDDCFTEDGTLTEMASDVVDHFQATYMEYSPSGNGLHIFCQGKKPNNRTRVPGLEVYSGKNFVTVTGDHVPQSGTKVLNMQDALDWLFDKYLPESVQVTAEIVEVNHGNRTAAEWLEIGLTHDDKFHRLYNDTDHEDDESAHDLALLCKLVYWLNRDSQAIEQVFFNSPWVHSKDMMHLNKIDKRTDYYERTFNKAMTITTTTAALNDRKARNIADSGIRLSETQDGEIVLPLSDYTDVSNAKLFSELYAHELAYTSEWGWCYFTGVNWELGQEYQAQQYAIEFAENMLYTAKQYWEMLLAKCEANGCTPASPAGKEIMAPAKAFMEHARKTNSEKGIKALLKLSESIMKVPASTFDGNPWVLNTPNVVVDLRTGENYPPAWNQYNSMTTSLVYDENAPNNGYWDAFLDKVFLGDEETISFVQKVMGAACVGKVYEERLFIAVGCGSNGKSTFFNAIRNVLGEYAMSINPDILMANVSYEQQITMASIKGKRLIVGQETESGQVMSTAAVKRLVSTDNIVGRVLYRGYIDFAPTHTTVLSTNHLPSIKDGDDGTWRRITVLPFRAMFTKAERITNYQEILLAEDGAYILKWLVDGARMFYENGCSFGKESDAVNFSTNSYKMSERDVVTQFCEEALTFVNPLQYPDAFVIPDEVYDKYCEWCMRFDVQPMSKMKFFRKISEMGQVDHRTVRMGKTTRRIWKNAVFKPEYGGVELVS